MRDRRPSAAAARALPRRRGAGAVRHHAGDRRRPPPRQHGPPGRHARLRPRHGVRRRAVHVLLHGVHGVHGGTGGRRTVVGPRSGTGRRGGRRTWWFPEQFLDGFVTGSVAESDGLVVSRVSRSVREGRRSLMTVRYTVADRAGLRAFTELETYSLFTHEEYTAAFTAAGSTPRTCPVRPTDGALRRGADVTRVTRDASRRPRTRTAPPHRRAGRVLRGSAHRHPHGRDGPAFAPGRSTTRSPAGALCAVCTA